MVHRTESRRQEPPPGPVSQTGRLRTFGPVLGLTVPAVLVTIALAVRTFWPCTGTGCVEPALAGWLLVLVALPTLLPSGLPWYLNAVTVPIALVTSAGAWLVLGSMAARRVARDPLAGWRDYWVELLVLAVGVGLGVLVGLGLIGIIAGL